MKLSDSDIRAIAFKIAEALHPQQVLVFGSYAMGTATEESDLDLMIVMDSDEPGYKRSVPIRNLFWPPKAPMDILVYTPQEVERWNGVTNHIITEAMQTGKVLYAA